ncbi:CAP domain-containing protein [Paraburkholderia megapolitana]|uniref:CAP domain-containing protein n=1 Tax=Paraburkholderia megapolitana TaxID=420953 RepID=UPI0038BBA7F3
MITKTAHSTLLKTTVIAAAASLAVLLAACGGGGGGSSAGSGATTPASGTSGASAPATALPPQSSVPAATYTSNSPAAQIFTTINGYRQQLGVGQMRQDTVLDTAALAHANYEQANLASGAITGYAHDEASTLPGFTGAWPLQRAQAAGAPKNEWVGEVVGGAYEANPPGTPGTDCANEWLDTVYHLQGVTSNTESMGVGVASSTPTSTTPGVGSTCVLDMGTSTGVGASPDTGNTADTNTVPYAGGQQFAANLIVHAPVSGETGVLTAMHVETPNPAPDVSVPGHPVMVRVNAQKGDTLTVSSFQLVDPNGAIVPARILVPQSAVSGSGAGVTADPNNGLLNGVAFLLPLGSLKANTTYTATFSGSRDGTPMSTSWSFTTGAQ